ncbi:MAG: chorismate mutase, partial [Clostridia bacterium]|nr:chorismate mutase [Clostridia bacterium]
MDKSKLNKLREDIDKIDRELVELFCRRMETASGIAEYKRESGMAVYDPIREREKLAAVANMAEDGMDSYIKQIYSLLFEVSRDYQSKLLGRSTDLYNKINDAIANTPNLFPQSPRVACQGTEGAYSMTAAEKLFKTPQIEYVKTFADVVRAVETGYVKYGVLPIENSTAGEVSAVLKLLESHDVYIVRAARCKIEHNALVNPGVKLSDIKEVISHEQAINQCSKFIESLGNVKITYAANTAVAAKYVHNSGRNDICAISSKHCANLYGLSAIERDVQNTDNNYTRFVCISKNIEIYPGSDKTTVMLITNNTPGSLYRVLSRFNALGINLTSIVSRPIEGRDFEFRFFFDFDTSIYAE